MKELDEIRARVVDYESRYVGSGSHAAQDRKVLLAAVEAVEALTDEWDAIGVGTTQFDSALRVCAYKTRAALTAALTTTPAAPSGAVGAGGAVVASVDGGGVRGAENGAERLGA